MTEPWNFTEAQRRQFREAHAEAKRKSIDELLHDPRPEMTGTYMGAPVRVGECPACGSEVRSEPCYVPGFTGMPVTCVHEWHDEED